jgi:hypothetical protein
MVDSFVAREDLVMGMLVNTVIPQVDMVIMAKVVFLQRNNSLRNKAEILIITFLLFRKSQHSKQILASNLPNSHKIRK